MFMCLRETASWISVCADWLGNIFYCYLSFRKSQTMVLVTLRYPIRIFDSNIDILSHFLNDCTIETVARITRDLGLLEKPNLPCNYSLNTASSCLAGLQ